MRVWRGKKGSPGQGRAFLLFPPHRGEGLWQEAGRTPEGAGVHFMHEEGARAFVGHGKKPGGRGEQQGAEGGGPLRLATHLARSCAPAVWLSRPLLRCSDRRRGWQAAHRRLTGRFQQLLHRSEQRGV